MAPHMHDTLSHTALTIHHITSSHAIALFLPEGSEVFCRSGRVLLRLAPSAGIEGNYGHVVPLAAGRGWRAPEDAWVQLVQDPAMTQTGCVAVQAAAAQTKESRSLLNGWERLLRVWRFQAIRRAQRAA